MTVEELIIYGKSKTSSTHAKMLLANLINKNPIELLTCLDEIVPDDICEKYKNQMDGLKQNKPIQYVIGTANFYGNEFIVNENVLIPRFETEELVENTLKYIDEIFPNKELDIIDLGTGTGCIGLTLKSKLNTSKITLVDISEKALEVANKNKDKLGLDVTLLKNDFLIDINDKYDVIISNPPYIKTEEEIEDIVKDNEPHLALYAGSDGMDCYKKIFERISNNLKDRYLIALEIGCEQGNDLIKLKEEYLSDSEIVIKKDLQGRDRMVFIYKK